MIAASASGKVDPGGGGRMRLLHNMGNRTAVWIAVVGLRGTAAGMTSSAVRKSRW